MSGWVVGRMITVASAVLLACYFGAPGVAKAAEPDQGPARVVSCQVLPAPDRHVAEHPNEPWSLALWRELVGMNKTEHPYGMYDETVDILRRAGNLPTYSGPLPESMREATKHDPCAFRFSKEMVDGHAVYYAVLLQPRTDTPYPVMDVELQVHGDKGRIFGLLGSILTDLVPPEAKWPK
jgi:hypothetical protein